MNPESYYVRSSAAIINELNWLTIVIRFRISQQQRTTYYENDPQTKRLFTPGYTDFSGIVPPELDTTAALGQVLTENNMVCPEARLLLALGMGTYFNPGVYAHFFSASGDRLLPHWAGGCRTQRYMDILPAGLTWLWLVADTNLEKRMELIHTLQSEKWNLLRDGLLTIAPNTANEPAYSGLIGLENELIQKLFPSN